MLSQRIPKLTGIIPRNFWDSKKMDNANPELGQSTWWTGNHVPGSANIAIKVGRSRVNIRPDFSGRSWHTNLNLLLNKQRLNHRNLLLSRSNYHRRSEFTEKISHRRSWHTSLFLLLKQRLNHRKSKFIEKIHTVCCGIIFIPFQFSKKILSLIYIFINLNPRSYHIIKLKLY